MESIRAVGIKTPIRVRPTPGKDGRFQLADGAMRVTCQRKLGKKTILAVVEALTDRQMKILAISQNIFIRFRDADKESAVYKLWESEFKTDEEDRPGVRKDSTYTGVREMSRETGMDAAWITRNLQSYETRALISKGASKEVQIAVKQASTQNLADLSAVAKDAPTVARDIVVARTEEAIKGVPLIRSADVREMAKAVEQAKTVEDKKRVADDLLTIRREAYKNMTKAVSPMQREMVEHIKGMVETPAEREARFKAAGNKADTAQKETEQKATQELVRSRAQIDQRQLVTYTRFLIEAKANTTDDSFRRVNEVGDEGVKKKTIETILSIAEGWTAFAARFRFKE